MVIEWSTTAVYNTIMAVSVGIGLLLIVRFFSHLHANKIGHLEGWAIGFAIPGLILTITGFHMSLTWPLSKMGFPFDDIIFGESSIAFGVLLLGITVLLWRKANLYLKQGIDTSNSTVVSEKLRKELPYLLKPISYFGAAMGFALIAMGCAGVTFHLFAAPPQEPISGLFADYPMIEATFMSLLLALTGVGAILFAVNQKENPSPSLFKFNQWAWTITGIIWTAFGIMNYFTHIGLIIHTLGH
ncbi:DUF981 family protein [Neobacillus vireti]|uniref:DUF981 domain-containing protein n=1 Tax=Neobacillus vireti LMG 21834 TaxID=1131730 RepID=A0AB94ITV5_9BACI|nr:DUF981 family protein [Neobacillus vireti]ETI70510.1 hypothetical protein BAVI_02139 [Neobacillus vireti LMG 21834]KLT19921.1 hypothetical protein AA980_05065 [Neobacillus vireti]